MRLHTVAFYKSVTPATTNNDLNIVTDAVFSRASGTGLYVPAGMELVAAFGGIGTAFGTNPRARVIAASLLRTGYPHIRPLDAGFGATDPNVQILLDRPIRFPNNEVVGVDAAWATSGASPVDCYALLWFRAGFDPLPPGDGFWVRYTSPTAAVANAWTPLVVTFDITLPEGNYAVVGHEHIMGSAGAARLVLPGSPWRPGTIGMATTSQRTHAAFYEGQFGVMGKFASFAPPGVEVLCPTTSSTHEGYLRVVRI